MTRILCRTQRAKPPSHHAQILLGRDNAFARAVAQGNVTRDAPIMRAVACDLDVLQQLALPLPRLAESIGDAAPIAGPYWISAGTKLSVVLT